MVVFMGAMVGLACARDLILLFVFFDLTAVASYFLSGSTAIVARRAGPPSWRCS
jgi:NADH:ubiquinone oxidoreductase subunit 5 (subunit L)/multisubunit Na+/H+ antiporter MnhA subunit